MPATSFHQPTGKWLTSFGKDAKAGEIHTISLGSTSKLHRYQSGTPKSCEFTTYLLGEPVASDEWGPLFDLEACASACPLDYNTYPVSADVILELSALPTLDRYAA